MSCSGPQKKCDSAMQAAGVPEGGATWAAGRRDGEHCPKCGGYLTGDGQCNQCASEVGANRFVQGNPRQASEVGRLIVQARRTRTDTGDVDPDEQRKLFHGLPKIIFRGEGEHKFEDLKQFAAASLGVDQVELQRISDAVGAKGVSGAPVYFTRIGEETVAITKIFPKQEEFVREISAIDRIASGNFERISTVRIFGGGQVLSDKPGSSGALVVSLAPGQPLDDIIKETGNAQGTDRKQSFRKLNEAAGMTGGGLAELHTKPMYSGRQASPAFMSRYTRALRDIARNILTDRVRKVAGKQVAGLPDRMEKLVEDFERNPGGAAIIHGDSHHGNIFYHPNNAVVVIDTPTLHWSMDSKGDPIGLAARDYENFIAKTLLFGRAYGLSKDEIGVIQKTFAEEYNAGGGAKLTNEAAKFFRARTLLGDLARTVTKNPSIPDEKLQREIIFILDNL